MASSSSYALFQIGEASVDQMASSAGGKGGAACTAMAVHAIILLSVLGIARVDPAVAPSPTAPVAIGAYLQR
jgi:hypothetical protein